MKSFLKKIFGLAKENADQAIQNAIDTDDVKKAYEILTSGAVDVNMKIYCKGIEYVDTHDYTEVTLTSCLLEKAKSDPMRRLLQHFGALSLEELKERWEAEDEQKKLERREREKRKQQEEEQRLAKKAEGDNRFLDGVLN